jgi:hypothetical protein
MHSSKSTGPKTKEGLRNTMAAATKHGFYAKEARNARKRMHMLLQDGRELLKQHNMKADPVTITLINSPPNVLTLIS